MLISDPRIWELNDTQVLAEIENLRLEKERREEEILLIGKFLKRSMVNMLGLNLMPLEDPDTGLLRRPEENEIIPLVALIGNPELLKVMNERQELLAEQEKVEEEMGKPGKVQELSPEELDDYINEDLLFVDEKELEKHLVMNSPHTQNLIKQVVRIREEVENNDNSGQVKESGKSDVIIESEEVSASPQEGGKVKINKPD